MSMLINPYVFAAAGGGGGVSTPDDVAGLILWLDADAITGLSDTDPVSIWADRSASGYDATASSTARPTYRTGQINGKPALDFVDGAGNRLNISMSETSGNWTWFFVIDSDTNAAAYRYMYDASSGRLVLAQLANNNDSPGWYDGTWRISPSTGTTGVQVLEYNLASGAGELYRDRTSILSSGYTQRALGGTQRIGSSYSDNNYFNGRMAEVVVYNSALGTTDRDTIYTYLNDKYGFTL